MKAVIWTTEIWQAAFVAVVLSGAGLPCIAADVPTEAAKAKAAPAQPKPTNVSPEIIAQWIQELDDNAFAVRDRATRKLSEVGEAAIDPLAIAAATGTLEVSTRAITALEANYLSESTNAAELAEEALEQVMSTANQAAALQAEQVLTFSDDVRQARAVDKIRELGGVVEYSDESRDFGRLRNNPDVPIDWVAIPLEWKGGDEGLKYIGRLKNLRYLYRIVGNQVSDAGLNKLKKNLPDLEIQPRGAMLGIEANRTEDRCLVSKVKPGSAAETGGIRTGDWIKSFGDKPVTDFESLIELIKLTRPGQEVTVVVIRGAKSVNLNLVMGGWSQAKP